MSDFVWVGNVSADPSVGANWQVGGVAQGAPPTAADVIHFGNGTNATNNNCTIPGATTILCRSIDTTGYTGTIAHATSTALLEIGDASGGAITIGSGTTISGGLGKWTLKATSDNSGAGWPITTNGKSLPALTCDGVGGKWSLQDALTSIGNFVGLNGYLVTNGYNVTTLLFQKNTGTFTLDHSNTVWNCTTTSGLTFWNVSVPTGFTVINNSSSIIVLTNASVNTRTFVSGGMTFGILRYIVSGSTGQMTLSGAFTGYDIEFYDSSNARSLQVNASITLTSPTAYENIRGTSGKLMSVFSSSAGVARNISKTGPGRISTDFVSLQDLKMLQPLKFYAGANSTDVSGNTNIHFTAPPAGPYQRQSICGLSTNSATSLSNTLPHAPVAGQLITTHIAFVGDPGAITPPANFNLDNARNRSTSVYVKTYSKVSDGTESVISFSWANSLTAQQSTEEYDGFTGVPTVDVLDGNDTVSATSILSGSGATNSAQPALAIIAVGGNGGMGNTTTPATNGFEDDWQANRQTTAAVLKQACKLLSSLASQASTLAWTTSRVPASITTIYKDVPRKSVVVANFM